MARRQRNRSALAGLAALGALGYISGKGPLGGLYKRREGDPAPVQDGVTSSQASASREDRPAASGYGGGSGSANMAPAPSLQETFMGLDDVSGPYAEIGGVGRVDAAAAPTGSIGPIIQGGAQAPVVAPAAASRTRSLSGQGAGAGAGAGANRADLRGYDDMYANRPPAAPVIGPRDTGVGGATAAELEAYERSLRSEAQRGRGYNRADLANNEAMRGRGYNRANAANNEAMRGRGYNRAVTMLEPRQIRPEDQAISRVYPEEYLVGGPGLKSLQSAAKALAAQTGQVGKTSAREAFDRAAQAERLSVDRGSAAQRAAVLRAERAEAARRGQTPTTFTSTRPSDSTKRTRKFNEEDSGVEFKRGGKTKKMASGGMTSASKRGDGIASKGKTKCKMY